MSWIGLVLLLLFGAGCQPAASSTLRPPPPEEAPAPPPGVQGVRICAAAEPGRPMVFFGQVLDYGGRPLGRAAVVAWHTDSAGLYNPPGAPSRVPRLRGVAVTDANGWYRFDSIRPAGYPDGRTPVHIHIQVAAPAHHVRNVEILFHDDPLLTDRLRREADGDSGRMIVRPAKGAGGAEVFRCDIRLEGN